MLVPEKCYDHNGLKISKNIFKYLVKILNNTARKLITQRFHLRISDPHLRINLWILPQFFYFASEQYYHDTIFVSIEFKIIHLS